MFVSRLFHTCYIDHYNKSLAMTDWVTLPSACKSHAQYVCSSYPMDEKQVTAALPPCDIAQSNVQIRSCGRCSSHPLFSIHQSSLKTSEIIISVSRKNRHLAHLKEKPPMPWLITTSSGARRVWENTCWERRRIPLDRCQVPSVKQTGVFIQTFTLGPVSCQIEEKCNWQYSDFG